MKKARFSSREEYEKRLNELIGYDERIFLEVYNIHEGIKDEAKSR